LDTWVLRPLKVTTRLCFKTMEAYHPRTQHHISKSGILSHTVAKTSKLSKIRIIATKNKCQTCDLGTHRKHTKEVNSLLFKSIKILSGDFEKLRKTTINFAMCVCPSVHPSVRLPECNNSALTVRILMKFGIWVLFENW